MSTGPVVLFLGDLSCETSNPSKSRLIEIRFTGWITCPIWTFGVTEGTTKDRLYGVPIVHGDAGDGAVAGFFQLTYVEMFVSLVLHEIIDRGWDLH